MRKGRFAEEQMVAIIREADREPVAVVARTGITNRRSTSGASIASTGMQRRAAAEGSTRGRECAAEEAGDDDRDQVLFRCIANDAFIQRLRIGITTLG